MSIPRSAEEIAWAFVLPRDELRVLLTGAPLEVLYLGGQPVLTRRLDQQITTWYGPVRDRGGGRRSR